MGAGESTLKHPAMKKKEIGCRHGGATAEAYAANFKKGPVQALAICVYVAALVQAKRLGKPLDEWSAPLAVALTDKGAERSGEGAQELLQLGKMFKGGFSDSDIMSDTVLSATTISDAFDIEFDSSVGDDKIKEIIDFPADFFTTVVVVDESMEGAAGPVVAKVTSMDKLTKAMNTITKSKASPSLLKDFAKCQEAMCTTLAK